MNTKLQFVNSFGCYGRGNGEFNYPNDIAQDGAGNLYVSDTSNNRVQVFDYKGEFLFSFSQKDASKQLCSPNGICVDSDQFVYVCDGGNGCVSVFKGTQFDMLHEDDLEEMRSLRPSDLEALRGKGKLV